MSFKKNNCIGIWGYGIVGKAIARYAHQQGSVVSIMDKRTLTTDEIKELSDKKIIFYSEQEKDTFFVSHDYIFSSPGINIAEHYATHKHKWLSELDVFAHLLQKPIIAVTGSIGKTSVTTMLAALLKLAQIPTCVGGNIGIATFDLLSEKNTVDYALLEVSSAQLQHCSTFAPHFALWTNIHPNHLDFHATYEEYFLAKYNIIAHQQPHQHAVMHIALRAQLPNIGNQQRSYFIAHKPDSLILEQLSNNERVYYVDNNIIIRHHHGKKIPIITLNDRLLHFSFIENIIMLAAAADILHINPQLILQLPDATQLPEHRLEKITTINNIDFYNDSKSTTTVSTLAAIEKLKHRPLHLFLGGLSKGVDREPFIAQLTSSVHHVYCFGQEAEILHNWCIKYGIPVQHYTHLTNAFAACLQQVRPGDTVLLSPAGSSYDLYNNYEERGKHFKELVNAN